MIEIRVNGERRSTRDGETVRGLINSLAFEGGDRGVAVAVNSDVVPRADWTATTLSSGDEVEIIHAVQGG